MPIRYSIITTCKGRLHNLVQTLPGFLRQNHTEVIVVDYDCPDGTAAYVARVHPAARLVAVKNQTRFNTAHARNLGAAQARGEILIFLDADVVIDEHFVATIGRQLPARAFARFGASAQNSLRGCCVLPRGDFETVGGYEELLTGYEGEDLELYMRLRLLGLKELILAPDAVVRVIEQSTEERERYRAPNLKMQFLRGQLYALAKEMVMTELGTPVLDLALRQKLLDEVNRGLEPLYRGDRDFSLEVNLPDKYRRGFLQDWEFSRSITVRARRKAVVPK